MYARDFHELTAGSDAQKRSKKKKLRDKEESIRDESVKFERNGAKKRG